MAKRKHCGDQQPHKPHKYFGPSEDPNETRQVEYQCPGSK